MLSDSSISPHPRHYLMLSSFFKPFYYVCRPPRRLSGKPPANAEEVGLIPGSGRLPEEGNSNPLQYSCLGNPIYISISHCGFKLHFPNSY